MFDINQITGEIVVASTLTEGLYSCNAIALTANANDMAQVINMHAYFHQIDWF